MSGVESTPEQMAELADMVRSLMLEVNSLKQELEKARSEPVPSSPDVPAPLSQDRQEAVMHTMQRIATLRSTTEMLKQQKAQDLLEEATNYAIANFKKNPPSWRK